ncbi:hypothetical protein DMN91_012963 [Ooceraea biroi]|uniref:Reverse transcriptase domain-containing protein n=1 Tax=Ooceraea biroi TaxID=2015173 RepID=A0A3L8D4B1_OOCBI|nr:uncharacterized protein LOC105286147 [Ooceraea biroi]RLU15076.1 hypothetical protein DMN91_012963 [Ooceraea biroi]
MCRKFLKVNKDIIVTRADKGQVTVIMDRNDYIKKMKELLSDKNTYVELDKDPVKKVTRRVGELVKSWVNLDLIDEHTHRWLNASHSNIARCYGLPKIHKTGYPLRVIVSAIGSPSYNLATFFHEILVKSINRPNSYVGNGWTFIDKVRNVAIDKCETMVSFDVVSLFTNIPKELVIKAIEKRWDLISVDTKFNLDQFIYGIDVILNSTSFTFNGRFYSQIYGCPMGSPLSPIVADMVLDDLETICMERLDFKIKLFYRYVDVFMILPTDRIQQVLEIFNNYHPRLCFTVETEKNGTINFLDATVIRDNEALITDWYRKPTYSGRYINYFASNPLQHKINVITNLVDRAILLSDERFHDKNIQILNSILIINCYPPEFINKHVRNRLKQIEYRKTKNNGSSNNENKIRMCIPYVKGFSECVARILRGCQVNVTHVINKTLDGIVKCEKDKLERKNKTDVIYRINCKDCDVCYVGQTKRHLNTRISEHLSDIKKCENNWSVVSKHRDNVDHEFDWSEVEVLHQEKHLRKRLIAEMFYIKKHKTSINLQKDTDNLSDMYDLVLTKL